MSAYTSKPGSKAPQGNKLHCKGWIQEAALRMLLNNLDAEVAEDPDQLIVYGGTGKAARNITCFNKIVELLQQLNDNETLLVQSGKPVGIVPTHENAPRVIIANSNLVPKWANWDKFRELEAQGLTMYGQMTAGSWIYIGSQGILQGTYETFMAAAKKHFNSDLKGKWVLSGGLGGMGGAQPLSATMAGGAFLGVDIDPTRIEKRLTTRYIDKMTYNLDEALNWVQEAAKNQKPLSVGLVGNAANVYEEILKRGIVPDLVTDQTSAHDPLNGYVPEGYSIMEARKFAQSSPQEYVEKSYQTMAKQVKCMVEFAKKGSHVFDYGNNIRAGAAMAGYEQGFSFPGFVPAYIRPLFCEGKGPFRWVALSGDPEDIYTTDQALMELFSDNKHLVSWLSQAKDKIAFQGLPSRICWLGYKDRERAGLLFNELVRTGKVKAPIVIGRDHLDCGSVASPNRETEAMKDGSDAIADWPLLNFALNAVNGASWVSFHHGGGVGMGYSLHSGMVIVADGSAEADKRLSRVLNADPFTGVMRHADAGYDEAKDVAKKYQLKIPFITI